MKRICRLATFDNLSTEELNCYCKELHELSYPRLVSLAARLTGKPEWEIRKSYTKSELCQRFGQTANVFQLQNLPTYLEEDENQVAIRAIEDTRCQKWLQPKEKKVEIPPVELKDLIEPFLGKPLVDFVKDPTSRERMYNWETIVTLPRAVSPLTNLPFEYKDLEVDQTAREKVRKMFRDQYGVNYPPIHEKPPSYRARFNRLVYEETPSDPIAQDLKGSALDTFDQGWMENTNLHNLALYLDKEEKAVLTPQERKQRVLRIKKDLEDLKSAISRDDVETVQSLLDEKRITPQLLEFVRWLPLTWAVLEDRPDMYKLLNPPDAKAAIQFYTLLAVYLDLTGMVKFFEEQARNYPDIKFEFRNQDVDNIDRFYYAARAGSEALETFLTGFRLSYVRPTLLANAVRLAIKQNHVNIVRYLYDYIKRNSRGRPVNDIVQLNDQDLLEAVQLGRAKIIPLYAFWRNGQLATPEAMTELLRNVTTTQTVEALQPYTTKTQVLNSGMIPLLLTEGKSDVLESLPALFNISKEDLMEKTPDGKLKRPELSPSLLVTTALNNKSINTLWVLANVYHFTRDEIEPIPELYRNSEVINTLWPPTSDQRRNDV